MKPRLAPSSRCEEPDSTIVLDEALGPVRIFVEQSLIVRGAFNHLDGVRTDLKRGWPWRSVWARAMA
jgi:hypothetical protein